MPSDLRRTPCTEHAFIGRFLPQRLAEEEHHAQADVAICRAPGPDQPQPHTYWWELALPPFYALPAATSRRQVLAAAWRAQGQLAESGGWLVGGRRRRLGEHLQAWCQTTPPLRQTRRAGWYASFLRAERQQAAATTGQQLGGIGCLVAMCCDLSPGRVAAPAALWAVSLGLGQLYQRRMADADLAARADASLKALRLPPPPGRSGQLAMALSTAPAPTARLAAATGR